MLLAMIPPEVLLVIWSITCTVACPLIATVLPGFFYYVNAKVNYDPEQSGKLKQAYGLLYASFGLIVMPIFLVFTIYTV